jgi:hypothetical protein
MSEEKCSLMYDQCDACGDLEQEAFGSSLDAIESMVYGISGQEMSESERLSARECVGDRESMGIDVKPRMEGI